MNHDSNPTSAGPGPSISEDAVRGALRRRAASRATGADAPTPSPRKLRRWSVAELIAGAVPRPPAGGVAR